MMSVVVRVSLEAFRGATRYRPARLHFALVAFPAALLLVGCPGRPLPGEEGPTSGIVVHNKTATSLTFEIILADGPNNMLGPIGPSRTSPIVFIGGPIPTNRLDIDANGCTKGVVIAYDPQRREVARHPPGLCVGETWVIEPQPGPT